MTDRWAGIGTDGRTRALLEEFECVAVNCSLVQQADDDEGRYFRTLVLQSGIQSGRWEDMSFEEAEAKAADWEFGLTHTHQGHFAGTSEGLLLGSSFGHRDGGDATAEMLEQAFAKWGELPAPAAAPLVPSVGARDPKKSWPATPDDDWVVLQLTCRDLDADPTAQKQVDMPDAFNNDHIWLAPAEAASLAPSAGLPQGSEFDAPQALAAKIARFHLIDTVRGEGVTWPEEAVQEARLTLRVESSGEGLGTFDETELTLLGDVTLTEHPDGASPADWSLESNEGSATSANTSTHKRPVWRGLTCSLLGKLTFDHALGRFTRFDAAATGLRWGRQHLEGRVGDEAPATIGFGLSLSEDRTTPPRGSPIAYWPEGVGRAGTDEFGRARL